MVDKRICIAILVMLFVAIYSSYRIWKDDMFIPYINKSDVIVEITQYCFDTPPWCLIKYTD